MEDFLYPGLDQARREIRLLTIQDGSNDSLVNCTMRTISLDDHPDLNALSYCWGDPNLTAPINVNNQVMNVTVNLEKSLRQLRNSGVLSGEIWVDAVCINQSDVTEKNYQVPLMSNIYSSSKVFIWLGGIDDRSNKQFTRNMEALNTLVNQTFIETLEPDEFANLVWFAVNFVLQPWWERTWTIQEFYLAKETTFMYGAHSFHMPKGESWLQAFRLITDRINNDSDLEKLIDVTLRSIHPDLALSRGPSKKLDVDPLDKIHSRFATIKFMKDLEDRRGQKTALFDAMRLSSGRKATNPRDKVYALLGMCPEEQRRLIQIDYDIEPLKLYHHVILYTWRRYFFGLSWWNCHLCNDWSSVPSWVVDFSTASDATDILYVYGYNEQWLKSEMASRTEISQDHRTLTFMATRLDRISFVHQPIEQSSIKNNRMVFQHLKEGFEALDAAADEPVELSSAYYPLEALRTRELPWELLGGTRFQESMDWKSEEWISSMGATLSTREVNQVLLSLIHEPFAEEICNLLLLAVDQDSNTPTWRHEIVSMMEVNMSKVFPDETIAQNYFYLFLCFIEDYVDRSQMSFFVTAKGFYGCSEVHVEVGDEIVIPHGAKFPIALRPCEAMSYDVIEQPKKSILRRLLTSKKHFIGTSDKDRKQLKREHRMIGVASISGLQNFAELEVHHKNGVLKDERYHVI